MLLRTRHGCQALGCAVSKAQRFTHLLFPRPAEKMVVDRLTNETLIKEHTARLDDGYWLDDMSAVTTSNLDRCRADTA